MTTSMSAKKMIPMSEFKKHEKEGDCWIEIEGSVYDVSEWMFKHPGGERLLECLGGRDASLPFLLNHHPSIRTKYLPSFYIGDLEKDPNRKPNKYDQLTVDFKKLYHELHGQGWFDPDYYYYIKKSLIVFSMIPSAIYLFYLSRYYDNFIFAILASIMIGMFWQQLAFIGHDIGHNGLTHTVWLDSAIGFIYGNVFEGISMGWWKYTHNVHHVRTNDVSFDPDIQHMPFIAISKRYLDDVFSRFHRRQLSPTVTGSFFDQLIAKIAIPYQRYHWFLTIMISRIFVYGSSLYFVFVQQPNGFNGHNVPKRTIFLEQIGLLVHHLYTFCIFYYCSPFYPLLFWFIAYFTAGILHIQIIMNHFPCPVFDEIEDGNFVVHQLKSSMAIKSNVYTHWFYGGLQFQVEHHLFPMMPRPKLRRVKPYILELCNKYDIPYLENSFWGAVKDIGLILNDVSGNFNKTKSL